MSTEMLAGDIVLQTISNLTPWNHSHVLDVEAAGMFETEVVHTKCTMQNRCAHF